MKTAESVRDFGVLTPAIVRPDPDGGYEIVSGHRRHRASELAGKKTMPAIVRDLDDDAAIILMVDANLQRETILPSERAFAYKMKLDAIKHQGERTDLTSAQLGAVDKVPDHLLRAEKSNKKDAYRRHPIHLIILFKFKAVAERRQWSSAASKPRRKTRVKLCPHFWAANVPSHQICRLRSASR